MPAVLNEAFQSPFDKVAGQGGNTYLESSGTNDIRAQAPQVQNLDFSGPTDPNPNPAPGSAPYYPYQQNYQVHPAIPSAGITWGHSGYNTLPQHSDLNQPQPHDCNQLINDIIACRVCRQKLQRLMKAWDEDHPEEVARRSGQGQEGGSVNLPFPLGDFSPNLITNIIIGIAIIFLLDRILKLRLK